MARTFYNRRPMNRPRPADVPVFREIVQRVPAADAARMYGVEVDRHGMACCPLHSEKTPSCKFYPGAGGFYCFGCGQGGDVITLVERMFGLSALEASKKLDADFSLGLFGDDGKVCESAPKMPPKTPEQRMREELDRIYSMPLPPKTDPAVYGAAIGRAQYLEYVLEEMRGQKCLQKK